MKKLSLFFIAAIMASPAHANDKPLLDFVEARLLEINNDNRSALKGYNILFAKESHSEILADRLFEIAVKEGDIPSALKAINKVEDIGPISSRVHILRFSEALKNENWQLASRSIEKIKSDPVFDFMAPILQAWVALGQGSDGTKLLDSSDNIGLTNYYASDQLVYQYLYQKQFDKVRQRIISVRPFSEAFSRDLILKSGVILHRNGKSEFARALLEAQGSGAAKSTLQIISSGKNIPKNMYELSPKIAVARLYGRISATLIDQKLYDLSVFFARTAQWLAPNDRAVALYLGASLAANDQSILASDLLNDIRQSDPYKSLYSSQNVKILLANDRNEEAVNVAEKTSELAPDSVALLLLLAQTYDSVDQFDNAAKTYQKLLDITPQDQNIRQSYFTLYRARSLTKAGQWIQAKKILDEGLKIEAENPYLLNFYGYSLIERGEDIERGFALVEQAYDLEPSSPDITDSLGWGYFLKGDLKKAIPLLEKAASVSKEDSEIKEHLGDAYWTAGRKIDARYIWRIASLIADNDDKIRLDHKAEYGLDIPYVKS